MARQAPADPQAAPTSDTEQPLLARLNARGFRLLMPLDAAVIAVALALPMVVRHGLDWPSYPLWAYASAYAGIVLLHLVALYLAGLYERGQRLGTRPVLPTAMGTTIGAVLLVALGELLAGVYLVPRANLPFVAVLAAVGVTANRALSERLHDRRAGPPRVLLVGAPDDVSLARRHLKEAPQRAEVVGSSAGTAGLVEAVARTGATDVLMLSGGALEDLYPTVLSDLEDGGIGVLQRITARDTLLGLRDVGEVAGMPCVPLRSHTLPVSRVRAKRAFELALLTLSAPVTVPVLLAVAAYVLAVGGRPVLFRQARVGKDGELFRIVKFRTMVRDAERDGEVIVATRRDARILPGCRWLRETRVDELPQLLNVLRGEMSLVGPRPERPELIADVGRFVPGYALRHGIPPGLTGLAQVQGRYHTDYAYKFSHDLQYLVNWSPVLDLQILARTVWVVLARKV